ncbi:Uncharacterised protein [uncultured archaeon]|nr:Uncharacterised protein [uncultured archaeon]
MKKLMTKEESERKSKRNQWIVGGVLMFIMLLSTAGYAINYESNTTKSDVITYKGTKFVKSDSYWYFNKESVDLVSRYNPKETENITFSINLKLSDYKGKPLYFVGGFQEANDELKRNLNTFALRMQDACLDTENCTSNLPAKKCSDDNVIIIKEPVNNETERVYGEGKCIFIIANLQDQSRYADAVLYKIFNI